MPRYVKFGASRFVGSGLVFSVAADGTETVVGGFSIDLRPLGFGVDAGFQNCAEFVTAAVIGIRAARRASVDVRRAQSSDWMMTRRPHLIEILLR